ncbi:unnamed protein product [Microthlaspi erraticum]|uniref:Uncharacterized protein n=1 Tax=Microthlaspi erraticum TaxID=1685480 RepID=A0A6D2JHQ5_9BRAS|nr:unnamed protein product [Microthlaspi erraticum]
MEDSGEKMWSSSGKGLDGFTEPDADPGSGKYGKQTGLLAWQASIYWLWHERNTRLHRQVFCSMDSINTQIDRQIRNKIAGFRDPTLASKLLQLWLSMEPAR